MGQELINFIYFVALLIAALVGVRSFHKLLALRNEKREVKQFFDSKLASDIKNAILDEMQKVKSAPGSEAKAERAQPKDPLAGLLMEIYDDLYARVAEEESARRKSHEELKGEIEKLRSELSGSK